MKIVTHDSSFHADDIFAVATLLLMFPDAEVIRSRKIEDIDSADYVVDVGMSYDPSRKRFDHHMAEGAGIRENGIPYASFGLVWKEWGEELSGSMRGAEILENKLVQPIDAHDNGVPIAEYKFEGVREYTIGDFLSSYLTHDDVSATLLYEIFMNNVYFARDLLKREINRAKETVIGEDLVKVFYEKSEDKRIIEIPSEHLPWKEILGRLPEPLFVKYIRRDGNWALKAVPDISKPYGYHRKDLPSAWGGKSLEELQEITGVPDAIFAHRNLFVVSAKSKEGIEALAEKALNA